MEYYDTKPKKPFHMCSMYDAASVWWFNCFSSQFLKNIKKKLYFIVLNYTLDYTLYPKLWFSIQDI